MTDARILWPAPEQSRLHWGWLAGELGAAAVYPLPRPFILAIRGVAPRDAETHETIARPAYDDTYVLFDPKGTTPPWVFAGATHSYQRDSRLSPDRDGDGRGDVGCIRPGAYVLTLAIDKPYPIFTVATPSGSARIPCFSDLNHDGRIDESERKKAIETVGGTQADASGYYSTAVLVHTGWDAPADSEHRSSISCLTMNARDLQGMAGFAKASGGKADLKLVDADYLVEVAKRSPFVSDDGAEPDRLA